MKKEYLSPIIKEILFGEDVVRCSVGGENGDDWIGDNKDLPRI